MPLTVVKLQHITVPINNELCLCFTVDEDPLSDFYAIMPQNKL